MTLINPDYQSPDETIEIDIQEKSELTYLQTVLYSIVIGTIGGLVATAYYFVLENCLELVWETGKEFWLPLFPAWLPAWNYTWIIASIGGLLVGIALYLLGLPGEMAMVIDSNAKNSKRRYAVIPDCFFQTLKDHFFGLNPNWYLFGRGRKPGPIVTGKNNHYNRHKEILKEYGYDRHVLYSWRHTSAVNIKKSKVPIWQGQKQFGHHSLQQFEAYTRGMGVYDLDELKENFPEI